ncbi:MAG: hypothetical protein AB7H96_13675 [Vicinamibacterales bacterium]
MTTAELTAETLEDLLPTLRALQERVGKKLAPLYAVKGPDGTQLTAVLFFWLQVAACPSYEKVGEAHPNYVLAEEAGQTRWAFCRKCHEPHSLKATQKSFSCSSCETRTVLDSAPVQSGTYTCPYCDERAPSIKLGREIEAPRRSARPRSGRWCGSKGRPANLHSTTSGRSRCLGGHPKPAISYRRPSSKRNSAPADTCA